MDLETLEAKPAGTRADPAFIRSLPARRRAAVALGVAGAVGLVLLLVGVFTAAPIGPVGPGGKAVGLVLAAPLVGLGWLIGRLLACPRCRKALSIFADPACEHCGLIVGPSE